MIGALTCLLLHAVSLHAEPATLLLDRSATSTVEVVVGERPPDARVSLWANAGAFSAVESLGGGRFRARYRPPAERLPGVVLILAVVEDRGQQSFGWLALPIVARAKLQLDTKPKAKVVVTVAKQSYGPNTADARGHLVLPIAVPPGVAAATVTATDRAGNTTVKSVSLNASPIHRTLAAAPRHVSSWSDPEPLTVEVFAVEEDGRALETPEQLNAAARRGRLEGPAAIAPGVFSYRYLAPDAVGDGRDVLEFAVGSSPATTFELALRPGPATHLAVALEPATYVAGSETAVQVSAQAADAKGNVTGASSPTVSVAFGATAASGASTTIRVPDAFAGRTESEVRASDGALRGKATLALAAGPPARADIHLARTALRAGETLEGRVVVYDAFGNAVQGAQLGASAGGGARDVALKELGGGTYVLTYETGPADAPAPLRVSVHSGDTALATSEAVELLPAEKAWAPSVGLWLDTQHNLVNAGSFGARVSLALRLGKSELEATAQASFLSYPGFDTAQGLTYVNPATGTSGTAPVHASAQAFFLEAGARYSVTLTHSLGLVATGLIGAARATAQVSACDASNPQDPLCPSGAPATTSGTLAATTWSARVGIGLSYGLGPGRARAQLEYGFASASALTDNGLQGNLLGVGLALGYDLVL